MDLALVVGFVPGEEDDDFAEGAFFAVAADGFGGEIFVAEGSDVIAEIFVVGGKGLADFGEGGDEGIRGRASAGEVGDEGFVLGRAFF